MIAASFVMGRRNSPSASVGREKKPSIRIWVSPSSMSTVVTPSHVALSSPSPGSGPSAQLMLSRLGRSRHSMTTTVTPTASTMATVVAAWIARRFHMSTVPPLSVPGGRSGARGNCPGHSRAGREESTPARGWDDGAPRRSAPTRLRRYWRPTQSLRYGHRP